MGIQIKTTAVSLRWRNAVHHPLRRRVLARGHARAAHDANRVDRRGDVPLRAITQGLGTIRRARSIVLLASGAHKGPALAAALHGPVTTDVPASVLQTHPNVTVVADRAAAALL